MKKVKYSELFEVVEGKVKKVISRGGLRFRGGLDIEIENTQESSPVRKLVYLDNSNNPAPLRYGDHIRGHYRKADEVVTKRKGPMVISGFYVPRETKEEENVEMLEILVDGSVVATYGWISDHQVEICKSVDQLS